MVASSHGWRWSCVSGCKDWSWDACATEATATIDNGRISERFRVVNHKPLVPAYGAASPAVADPRQSGSARYARTVGAIVGGVPSKRRVLELLRQFGHNTTSFQVLEPGLAYWFDGDDACVAYADTAVLTIRRACYSANKRP